MLLCPPFTLSQYKGIHESGPIKPLKILKAKLFVLCYKNKDSRAITCKILACTGLQPPAISRTLRKLSLFWAENFSLESMNFIFSFSLKFLTSFLLIYKHSKILTSHVFLVGVRRGKIFAGGVIFGWAYFLRGL